MPRAPMNNDLMGEAILLSILLARGQTSTKRRLCRREGRVLLIAHVIAPFSPRH